jgi:hypothetical protein
MQFMVTRYKEDNVIMATRGNTLSRTYHKISASNRILIIGGGIVGNPLPKIQYSHFFRC